jgi:glycosyltransferase involved in cell wall biosynthesis
MAERQALLAADRVVTPHADYATMFSRIRKLEWERPVVEPPPFARRPGALLFPADLAAREGAHAALIAADRLNLPLLVLGKDVEGLGADSRHVHFIKSAELPWHEIAAVIHPTLFESWPRLHLQALALEIPVIATEACGLSEEAGVRLVSFADDEALTRALDRSIVKETDFEIEPHLKPRGYSEGPDVSN